MLNTARRLLTSSLLVAAVGTGLALAPAAANAATVPATVKVASTLKVRATPSLSGKIVGSVRNNQRIDIQCVAAGTTVRGSVRTSNLWAKVGAGKYIAFAYIGASRTVSRCSTTTPQAVPVKNKPNTTSGAAKYIIGTIRSTDGPVNMRTAPGTAGAVVLKLNNGQRALLVCSVTGQKIAGTVRTTTQWNRTSTGNYLSHAFMITPALPVCKGSTPPSSSPTQTPEIGRAHV